jgi:hypothetical protein
MAPILLLVLAFSGSAQELPWQDLDLSIEKDFSVSSDRVTLCRVRVVNRGQHSWPGSRVRFEAVALEGGVPMARERGRFGLSLAPHETLETVIAFPGLYTRFEVRPLFKDFEAGKSSSRRGARARSTKKKPKKGA